MSDFAKKPLKKALRRLLLFCSAVGWSELINRNKNNPIPVNVGVRSSPQPTTTKKTMRLVNTIERIFNYFFQCTQILGKNHGFYRL